jgi:hypothetical protein
MLPVRYIWELHSHDIKLFWISGINSEINHFKMNIPLEIKRYIDAQKQNTINYAAVSSKSESITDGVSTVRINSFTKEIVLETFDHGFKKAITINIPLGLLKELQTIIFSNGSKITGVSDGSKLMEEDPDLSESLMLNEKFLEVIAEYFLDTYEALNSNLESPIYHAHQLEDLEAYCQSLMNAFSITFDESMNRYDLELNHDLRMK